MLLEEARGDVEVVDGCDGGGVLHGAVGEPDLDDAKVFLGRDGDAVEQGVVLLLEEEALAADREEQVSPDGVHVLEVDFEGEASPVSVARVFPLRRDSRAHDKEHALFDKVFVHQLGKEHDFFGEGDTLLNHVVALEAPGLLEGQVEVVVPLAHERVLQEKGRRVPTTIRRRRRPYFCDPPRRLLRHVGYRLACLLARLLARFGG